MDLQLRIDALEAQVERQALRIDELEGMLSAELRLPVEWGLPRREMQIFALLVKRDRVTKEMLSAVYADDSIAESDTTVWESHVSKMRKRLKPFGVEIESKRHLGWRLLDRERYHRLTGEVA